MSRRWMLVVALVGCGPTPRNHGHGDGGGDGSCAPSCSGDLHSIVDCNNNVISTCPPDQACGNGACTDPCAAAAAVIALLREREHQVDPIAQLVLANCLIFTRRFGAYETYERVAATWPEHRSAALAGNARALVALDRAADALALLDGAPNDADVCDAHAAAFDRLGRADEAASSHRLATALATRRLDLRLQAVGATLSKPT